jgi:hypothetical protein
MNTDIIDQANQIIVQGAEMVKRLRETLEEERRERGRLEGMVDDLTDALRRANAALEKGASVTAAASVRRTLERHGLLRDVDRPEWVPEFMRGPASRDCPTCGAKGWEPCTLGCEDRR